MSVSHHVCSTQRYLGAVVVPVRVVGVHTDVVVLLAVPFLVAVVEAVCFEVAVPAFGTGGRFSASV